MDLILWRHCDAEPDGPDLERRLTAKGTKQAERVAQWLDRYLPDACRILVSPALRCQQTALQLDRKIRTLPDLAPGAGPDEVLRAANWPDARESALVVAHQPTLGLVASLLLAGEPAGWPLRTGAVWWISGVSREAGAGVVLRVVIGPDYL